MKHLTDCFTLSNGVKIPCIGFGTFQSQDGPETEGAVQSALQAGYRHIDTALDYYNEESVGKAIAKSDVKREDIFLTTKHWITDRGYDKTVKAVEDALKRLGTDYLDLYLIHWPMVEKTSGDWKEVNSDTWRGFEKMYLDGKIRAIGVSNFLPHHLQPLMESAQIKPMVNQIEFHPGYNQMETVNWCQAHGIQVEAWSPLGCGRLISDPTLCDIAAKYNKSTAQLCIRYALQHNVLPLPKSVHQERIAQNTEVFDFTITEEDMKTMDALPLTGCSGWFPDDAPAEDYQPE